MFKDAVLEISDEYEIDIQRLYDTVNMKFIVQPADFICYRYPNQIYVECKSTVSHSFAIYNQKQYERLLEKSKKKGVVAGMLIWFIEDKRVFWVDVVWAKIFKETTGAKSVSVTKLSDRANKEISGVFEIDQKTTRVNPKMDLRSFFDKIKKYYGE